jgi:DNA-binding CsgD family transcriptional regulator
VQAWLIRYTREECLPAMTAVGIVEGIGRDCFAERVLCAVQPVFRASHCVALAIDAADAAPLGFSSVDGEGARFAGAHFIASGYFREDNNLRLLGRLAREPVPGPSILSCQSPVDVRNLDHRETCYERLGIVERLSIVVCPHGPAKPLFLNLYRTGRDGAVSGRELDSLHTLAPLLAGALARHAELVAAPVRRSTSDPFAALSARERTVIDGICAGLSTKEIAQQLDIKVTTVITYRQRAYQRLGIQRQLDLIRLLRQ